MLTNMSTMLTDHTRDIAAAIVAAMQEQPRPVPARSLRKSYLVIAVVALVLLLIQIRSLIRSWRRVQKAAVIPTLIFDLGIPIAILFLVPRWLGVSLRAVIEGAPDLALFMALLMALSLATGMVKLWQRKGRSA